MPRTAKTPLTELAVRKAKPPAQGQVELWDAAVPGFGLRVSAGGAKAWVLTYRLHGRPRRLTLGRFPTLGLAEARQAAREAQRDVSLDVDPATKKKATAGNGAEQGESFVAVVATFIERYAKPKNRSWPETERLLTKELVPLWGRRPLAAITRRDVHEALDRIVDRGAPVVANRTLAAVRKLFNWALERGLVEASPCAGIRPPGPVASRDRVLTDDELAAIWHASGAVGWRFGAIVRLLILTAQRRAEVGGMRWRNLDLDRGLWTLPKELTKAERRHAVPLSPQALALLHGLPRVESASGYVFPAKRLASERPASGFSKAKERLDRLSGVAGWRLHDLRRTAATGMAGLGTRLEVVGRVLNHSGGSFAGVVGVYNRFSYLPQMREALGAWGRHVEGLTADPEGSLAREA